jgi:hypothetical protein
MSSGMSLNGREIFESDWLGSIDLAGKDLTLKIVLVEKAEVFNPGTNKKSFKLAFRFENQVKGMICNRTNATTIAKMYGNEASVWAGKQITLYPTTCRVARETQSCIRVREKPSTTQTPAPPAAPNQSRHPLAAPFAAMQQLWKIRRAAAGLTVTAADLSVFISTALDGLVTVENARKLEAHTIETIAKVVDAISF